MQHSQPNYNAVTTLWRNGFIGVMVAQGGLFLRDLFPMHDGGSHPRLVAVGNTLAIAGELMAAVGLGQGAWAGWRARRSDRAA